MTVLEKAYELRRQLALAKSDISYDTQIIWGQDKNETITHINNLISKTLELFSTNRINDVDYDLREQVYRDYDIKLENELRRFPQYLETIASNNKSR